MGKSGSPPHFPLFAGVQSGNYEGDRSADYEKVLIKYANEFKPY